MIRRSTWVAMMRRKTAAAASLFTAERTIARRGARVAGFSQTPKTNRVSRSPTPSSGPSSTALGASMAGAKESVTAASNTWSFVPK